MKTACWEAIISARGKAMRSIPIKTTTKLFVAAMVLLLATMFSCASSNSQPDEFGKGRVVDRKPLSDPPSYQQLADSLKYYEKQLDIKFYKNSKGRFVPYSTSGWQTFSIADDLNECLYDISMRGIVTYRYLGGKTRSMIEMEISRGPCGLRYPDAETSAMDRVTLMEGSVITPAIKRQLDKAASMPTGARFLQDILNLPFAIGSLDGGLEQSIAKMGKEVKNPLDITYGDVVFFTEYYGERNVGVYVDYGLMVYNSCFQSLARHMDQNINYRIYRIFTGFNMIKYKLHENVFMQEIVGGGTGY